MNELFIGMLLVLLDVNAEISRYTLDLLPDFVGYLLMMRGLDTMGSQSACFRKARPLAVAMMIGSAVLYVVEATAVTVHSQFLSFCLGALATAVSLLIGYRTVSGIRDVERQQNRDLEGEKLHSMWLYMAVIQAITYACGWIPLVGAMGSIAALVMNVCFLAAFYRTKNLYDAKS